VASYKRHAIALANYIDEDPDDVSYVGDAYGSGELWEIGNSEYVIYASYDDAVEGAEEDVRQIFDDLGPEAFVKGFAARFISLRGADIADIANGAESYIWDLDDEDACARADREDQYEDLEDKVAAAEEDDDDVAAEQYTSDMGSLADSCREQLYDNEVESVSAALREDPVGYYLEEFGEVPDWLSNYVDVDALAEEAVNIDGAAHFLAGYDGDEIELDTGAYVYRVN